MWPWTTPLSLQVDCCVRHTALDLLNEGYEVFIVADACSTTGQASRQFGIKVEFTNPEQDLIITNTVKRSAWLK